MNITTRTTIVSNVQLDDNIRVWLLEEEGFKSRRRKLESVGAETTCIATLLRDQVLSHRNNLTKCSNDSEHCTAAVRLSVSFWACVIHSVWYPMWSCYCESSTASLVLSFLYSLSFQIASWLLTWNRRICDHTSVFSFFWTSIRVLCDQTILSKRRKDVLFDTDY